MKDFFKSAATEAPSLPTATKENPNAILQYVNFATRETYNVAKDLGKRMEQKVKQPAQDMAQNFR